MSQLKSNIFIASITIYIIGIKFFELLFSLGKFLTVDNSLSNIVFYIISTICGLLSLFVIRLLYKKYNDNWLYFLIGGTLIMYLAAYFISRNLGEVTGESPVFDVEKFVLYENVRSYVFIAMHIILFIFYKYLFGKETK